MFVTVPWDFNPVPYRQPSSHTPMEYALLPSLEWHVWPGWRSIYNKFVWDSRHTDIVEDIFIDRQSFKSIVSQYIAPAVLPDELHIAAGLDYKKMTNTCI